MDPELGTLPQPAHLLEEQVRLLGELNQRLEEIKRLEQQTRDQLSALSIATNTLVDLQYAPRQAAVTDFGMPLQAMVALLLKLVLATFIVAAFFGLIGLGIWVLATLLDPSIFSIG